MGMAFAVVWVVIVPWIERWSDLPSGGGPVKTSASSVGRFVMAMSRHDLRMFWGMWVGCRTIW